MGRADLEAGAEPPDDGDGDPVALGEAWAAQQERAFGAWIERYGVHETVWDFGEDSLDWVSYVLFHRTPTAEHVADPAHREFVDGAAWYLGEIVRRSEPKKMRWRRNDYDLHEGEYVVEPEPLTRRSEYVAPHAHLRSAVRRGNPQFLRAWYGDYVNPRWTKPWPVWIHETGDGTWSWDAGGTRWVSQRDQWRESIAELLGTLAAAVPSVALDYSTASLQQLEAFVLADEAAADPTVRSALVAYVGECVRRTAGGEWIVEDRLDSIHLGFPVVDGSLKADKISPTHVLEYARAWRDGDTLARLHRGALAHQRSERARGRPVRRQPTPGLDPAPARDPAEVWADDVATRFDDWVRRYGPARVWDFTPGSLDALADVMREHCPVGVPFLHGDADDDCLDGVVWYFGECLRRAKPAWWQREDSVHGDGTRVDEPIRPCANMTVNTRVGHDKSSTVFLVQELDHVVGRPRGGPPPQQPTRFPGWLRTKYESWITGPVTWRVEASLRRRQGVTSRRWRSLDDDAYLQRWITQRRNGFAPWVERFGGDADWDFANLDALDSLESLVWQTRCPEVLLEDPDTRDFVDGAVWYLGETVRRAGADTGRWTFTRGNRPDPYVWAAGGATGSAEPVDALAEVFMDVQHRGGTLRAWRAAALR